MKLFWVALLSLAMGCCYIIGISVGLVRPVADNWVSGCFALLLGFILFSVPATRRACPRTSKALLIVSGVGLLGVAGFWLLVILAFSEVGIGH